MASGDLLQDQFAMLTILLLAAGSSSRMRGQDKLLQEVDGTPLIRTMAKRALSTDCPVLVTLPANATARLAALDGLDLATLPVLDAKDGMAHSLRAGIASLPKTCSGAMVLPADMPELTSRDLARMVEAFRVTPNRIVRATSADGRPGHPVIFPAAFFEDLRHLRGDQGGRAILQAQSNRVSHVPLPDQHALTDLDTPEDWDSWRANLGA